MKIQKLTEAHYWHLEGYLIYNTISLLCNSFQIFFALNTTTEQSKHLRKRLKN